MGSDGARAGAVRQTSDARNEGRPMIFQQRLHLGKDDISVRRRWRVDRKRLGVAAVENAHRAERV